MGTNIVLTRPNSLENALPGCDVEYRAPNFMKRLLSLFKTVRPGSDLTQMQLPPLFNMPKSHLQMYGEDLYATSSGGSELLSRCNRGKDPLERLIAVVAWSLSTRRPPPRGVAPYNPILGETHHVSKGSFNLLLEQVSHRPPVTGIHGTDDKENIELIWCQHLVSNFTGATVDVETQGKRKLKLLNHGETYEMNLPNLFIRFFPVPGIDWVGKFNIRCIETGLVAELNYVGESFLGFRKSRRSIKGKIIDSSSGKILYEISGHWDSTVTLKDTNSGELRVIYDAREVLSGLQAPIVKDPQNVLPTESALVWSEVSKAILSKNWEKAKEAKKFVEEREREIRKERELKGETWISKHFVVSQPKDGSGVWDCVPIQKRVPPAPIVAL